MYLNIIAFNISEYLMVFASPQLKKNVNIHLLIVCFQRLLLVELIKSTLVDYPVTFH